MHLDAPPTPVAPPGLRVDVATEDGLVTWTVANETGEPTAVERVALRWRLRPDGPLRVLRHGYQSWTATGASVLGREGDPSRARNSPTLARDVHNADPTVAPPDELRSHLVTAVADDGTAWVLGFDGGARHDGVFRIRPVGEPASSTTTGPGEVEVEAEAYLGGAVLAPGEERRLHPVRCTPGDPHEQLEGWADWAGSESRARAAAPFQVGWCSWYQYFHAVTENDVRANLALAREWPVDVFQLDDGYQAHIGDWLERTDTFPTPLEELASDVRVAGFVPGIWIAPFLAAPESRVARQHPDWVVHHPSGRALIGMANPNWGGQVHVLDTTNPEVLEHLTSLARTLVDMGWHYLKLDFTYAPSFRGVDYADPSMTPAERVRAGYDAIRRGAGDDAFVLGCGAPLGACIGAVDGMRIGPDVAPSWTVPATAWNPPGYVDCEPSVANAWRNTLTRSFQHRRLWLNDPDCLMLRTDDTALTVAQVDAWAQAVAVSGGMALVSDDLSRLGAVERARLDEVLRIGRESDDAARAGRTARTPDLMDTWTPTSFRSGDAHAELPR